MNQKLSLYLLGFLLFLNGSENALAQQEPTQFIKLRDSALSLKVHDDYGFAIYGVHDEQLRQAVFNKKRLKKYISPTRCAKTEEMSAAVMCISIESSEMNNIFSRISIFAEGYNFTDRNGNVEHFAPGTLIALDHPALQYHRRTTAGHNLAGKQMIDFFVAARASTSKKLQPNQYEKELYTQVILPLFHENNVKFIIITGAMDSIMDRKQVFSHEALHAAFYLHKDIQHAVKKYWDEELEQDERDFYKDTLKELSYNIDNNEFVLLNEFFAYTLNYGYDDEYNYFHPFTVENHPALLDFVNKRSDFDLQSILFN